MRSWRYDTPTPEEARIASEVGEAFPGKGRGLFWWAIGGFALVVILAFLTALRFFLGWFFLR
jgi:hypothetical protein